VEKLLLLGFHLLEVVHVFVSAAGNGRSILKRGKRLGFLRDLFVLGQQASLAVLSQEGGNLCVLEQGVLGPLLELDRLSWNSRARLPLLLFNLRGPTE